MKLLNIACIVKGTLYGEPDFEIVNITPYDEAKGSDLTFLFNPVKETEAGAVIAAERIDGKSGIVVEDPKEAMYRLLKDLAGWERKSFVSSSSIIDDNVDLASQCTIEPFAIIKKNVKIGKGTYIGAHCYIDEGVVIGDNCEIFPSTVVYRNTKIGNFVVINSHSVISKEGFGYIKKAVRYEKLKHIGGVLIHDFVEIGGNVTIDRGTIGDTVIGEGTKIDNLVHIAHNVKVGKNCIIMGQSGIAGSAKIGNNVVLCGQVGISDHVIIGNNVVVYAKSAVFKPVPENSKYSGIPARKHVHVLRAIARLYKGL